MPRRNLPKGYKAKPSTFWTMKENSNGASVGNFVGNVNSLPKAFAAAGSALKNGRFGEMLYRDMSPEGKDLVDAVKKKTGYISKATRAGMKKTDIAGRKGQLGYKWGE